MRSAWTVASSAALALMAVPLGCSGGADCIPSLPNTGKPAGDLLIKVQSGHRPGAGPMALAGRLELKAPTGGFDPSIFSAPLTEGQWDVTLVASVGASVHP